jgi:hypothetical protein
MDESDERDKRFEEAAIYWSGDGTDPDFSFDAEDLEISGYFNLNDDEVYAVQKALHTGLGRLVAAMWWVNGLLPVDIITSRLLRFPQEEAFAAGRLIWSLPENSRWPVVHTTYTLYQFSKQRDDDYRRIHEHR